MARDDQDRYLDIMDDLVGHPGWRLLEEEFKAKIYQFQADALDHNVTKSWDNVNVLRGAAQQLAELLRLPEQLQVLRQARSENSGD